MIDLNPKMRAKELAALLRDMATRVELGDSFEGQISYSCMDVNLPPGDFYVFGNYRIGNTEGQGGMRLIGDSTPEHERSEAQHEEDKRELDALYAWAALHPDPRQGWTQIGGLIPMLGYSCVLTHRMHSIVTSDAFRGIAAAHRAASGQRVELREYRFLKTLEVLP